MTHSSAPDWSNNTINTPSPIFFPSASPTPKLSSTPTKKPPSPVDWHEEMNRDERQSEANKRYPEASFTFDGDLTRPELDSLLEKLQQSTLSADTMTSSFLGDLDDDILPDDFFAVLSAPPPISPQMQKQIQQESDSQQLRQWLDQLPDVVPGETREMKWASFVKQWMSRMKKSGGWKQKG
ncbi:hypothetical protein BC941DRAFT_431239 [Chlamydoabsidia padenii]|nr:hypothetical protein BC941DRAFT_431239 [Chlamydoabsidia padenii]